MKSVNIFLKTIAIKIQKNIHDKHYLVKMQALTLSRQRFCHIETSSFICIANQWTGFYMVGTSVMKELNHWLGHLILLNFQPFKSMKEYDYSLFEDYICTKTGSITTNIVKVDHSRYLSKRNFNIPIFIYCTHKLCKHETQGSAKHP